MKLTEHDGKNLLKKIGISIPEGVPLNAMVLTNLKYPMMLKAQVLQGRRGQRGLVRRVDRAEDLETAIADVQSRVGDMPCAGILIEPVISVISEWLLSIAVDPSGRLRVSWSEDGGMNVSEIESVLFNHTSPLSQDLDLRTDLVAGMEEIKKYISPPMQQGEGLGWGELKGRSGGVEGVESTIASCLRGMVEHDLISIEINPLGILSDGSVVALDAKIEVDDAAAFRHPEWNDFAVLPPSGLRMTDREERFAALRSRTGHRGTMGRYVELDGDVAMILSGGGASLVAMDALLRAGGRAANYVEMSGNPDPDRVFEAARIVFTKPGLRAVWIAGSFANFTDIHQTVMATLRAYEDVGLHVPIVIRRDGPFADIAERAARAWAIDHDVSLEFHRADVDLDTSAERLIASLIDSTHLPSYDPGPLLSVRTLNANASREGVGDESSNADEITNV